MANEKPEAATSGFSVLIRDFGHLDQATYICNAK